MKEPAGTVQVSAVPHAGMGPSPYSRGALPPSHVPASALPHSAGCPGRRPARPPTPSANTPRRLAFLPRRPRPGPLAPLSRSQGRGASASEERGDGCRPPRASASSRGAVVAGRPPQGTPRRSRAPQGGRRARPQPSYPARARRTAARPAVPPPGLSRWPRRRPEMSEAERSRGRRTGGRRAPRRHQAGSPPALRLTEMRRERGRAALGPAVTQRPPPPPGSPRWERCPSGAGGAVGWGGWGARSGGPAGGRRPRPLPGRASPRRGRAPAVSRRRRSARAGERPSGEAGAGAAASRGRGTVRQQGRAAEGGVPGERRPSRRVSRPPPRQRRGR